MSFCTDSTEYLSDKILTKRANNVFRSTTINILQYTTVYCTHQQVSCGSLQYIIYRQYTTTTTTTVPQYNLLHTLYHCIDFVVYRRYIIIYLLTPWCRVLLEKLAGLQLVKKFPAFHGTRRFITALTSVRHLSLSWASPIQSKHPHPTSRRSILILSTHRRLGLPSGLLPYSSSSKTLHTPLSHPYAPHAQPISLTVYNIL